MVAKVIPFTFDKDALWRKVRDMKAVFLDMNGWVNMADDKTPQATGVKAALRKAVSDGRVFCPLSYGILTELYKQEFDSRMRVGQLMEDLSLNVAYANRSEVFTWEVERFVSGELGVGPIDLSLSGLYVPLVLYMSSGLKIGFPEKTDSEEMREKVEGLRQALESLTLTEILKMTYRDGEDWESKYVKGLPDPPLEGVVQRIREGTKGDKNTMLLWESQAALELEVIPYLSRSSPEVKQRFMEYVQAGAAEAEADKSTGRKEKYAEFLANLLKKMPALYNHVELVATIAQNPAQRFEINDFFDHEIMPVPLAYASAFVAQDKGIRDLLRNRTKILPRNACCYCSNLGELEAWMKAEGLA
jgi:hypothetical protein